MRDTIAAVETFPTVGMRNPEVEIVRPFGDSGQRINAMHDFAAMVEWFVEASRSWEVVMCRVEGDQIVWKFLCRDRATAEAFDAAFDKGEEAMSSDGKRVVIESRDCCSRCGLWDRSWIPPVESLADRGECRAKPEIPAALCTKPDDFCRRYVPAREE